jgi:hypothetical protein
LTVWDYYLYTGDLEIVAEVYPTVEKILGWFKRQEDSNGLLADLPYWHFIEWANTIRSGESATVNAMYCGTLDCAAKLAKHLDYGYAESQYEKRRDRVANALNQRHWNPSLQLYVDSVDPQTGDQKPGLSQHANSAMILWNIAPENRWPSIIDSITDKARLRLSSVYPITQGDPDFDRETHIVKANTFFAHFVYCAIAKAGHFDRVLDAMHSHYKNMISQGAETLWESVEPTASLCHAFSATPVYQLSANCLGVTPTEPGFREFALNIQPGELSKATGVFPSPAGPIPVNWKIEDRRLMVNITVPERTSCTVSEPPGYQLNEDMTQLQPGQHSLIFTKQ